jgi:hypothetical protein
MYTDNGDWGLGPNPQSPIPNPHLFQQIFYKKEVLKFNYVKLF